MASEETCGVCPDCGSTELIAGVEFSKACPCGTGYMVEICAACGTPTGERREWVGF